MSPLGQEKVKGKLNEQTEQSVHLTGSLVLGERAVRGGETIPQNEVYIPLDTPLPPLTSRAGQISWGKATTKLRLDNSRS